MLDMEQNAETPLPKYGCARPYFNILWKILEPYLAKNVPCRLLAHPERIANVVASGARLNQLFSRTLRKASKLHFSTMRVRIFVFRKVPYFLMQKFRDNMRKL